MRRLGRFGLWEVLLVLFILALVIGPRRFVDIGKALGKGLIGFKEGTRSSEESPPSGDGGGEPADRP